MSWSIVIGNGFTIDAYKHCKIKESPNHPWNWKIKNPYNSNQDLLDVMPSLKAHLESQGELSDLEVYGALQDIVHETQSRSPYRPGEKETEQDRIHAEACHYLRLAYVWYTDLFKPDKLYDWAWRKWFSRYGHEIETILSLNYDLILETVMRSTYLGKVYGSSRKNPPFGKGFTPMSDDPYSDEKKGDKKVIHIAKPHGSCNFTSWAVTYTADEHGARPLYPLNMLAVRSSPLKILTEKNVYQAVSVADLVLPGEWSCWGENALTTVTWANEQKQHFIDESKSADKLLVVGFGYSEPDCPEFDNILARLNKFQEVHIVNPSPSDELIAALKPFSKENFFIWDSPLPLIT